ncbi:LOW QUALITY PROTEIN: hypothetical protein TorRG33x02_212400 [Trema orientale]|uniref:Uncharacterized protein n=1 Tax=Trema orientale TaxID=63057 RepID=A0A2P5EBQ1_TREOI|nr:LOW QUALITY PROTEIN: hypothetical protein TorRG33x02_212400 [Trema orientale]
MMKALHNRQLHLRRFPSTPLPAEKGCISITHYATMISIFVSLCLFYVLAATVAHVGLPHPPQAAVLTISNTSNYAIILSQISLFAGFLAAVLQLTILVPPFGWFTFALWVLFFVKFAFHLLCINLFPRLLSPLLYMWIKATGGERVEAQNRVRRPPV